jgi:hypothetical protein
VQAVAPPQSAPDQPANVEPPAGVAESDTIEPDVKAAEHVSPHDSPDGSDVTVPLPVPR